MSCRCFSVFDMRKIIRYGTGSGVVMAATALGLVTLYLLMSQATKFATEARFRESKIVPDVISTAPSFAAEVRQVGQVTCNPTWNALVRSTITTYHWTGS